MHPYYKGLLLRRAIWTVCVVLIWLYFMVHEDGPTGATTISIIFLWVWRLFLPRNKVAIIARQMRQQRQQRELITLAEAEFRNRPS